MKFDNLQNMNVDEMLNNNNYCNVDTGLKRSKSFTKEDCGLNENESKGLLQKNKNVIVIPKLEIDKLKGYEQVVKDNYDDGKENIKMNAYDGSDISNHVHENKFISYDKYKFIFEDEITPRSERERKNKRKKSTIGNSGNETERSKMSRRKRTVPVDKM